MSMTKAITDDAELAKSYITNSALSDDYKKTYLRLINISTMATNGISVEEKIQKMTECIQLLAVTQGMYLAGMDKRIDDAIDRANSKKCENCKAMKHANKVEQAEYDKKLIEKYREQLGLPPLDDDIQTPKTWTEVFKQILLKPYAYVVAIILIISPYSAEIIKTIAELLVK